MSVAPNPLPQTKPRSNERRGIPKDAPAPGIASGRTTPYRSPPELLPMLSPVAPGEPIPDPLTILRPATLREQAREALRDAILRLRFRPGQRLTESMLCRVTGVSRTIVREALRNLESEGLIEYVPGRGAFVAGCSADDIRDCYEIGGAMQERAARAYAQRAGDEAVAKLRTAVENLQAAARARETNRLRIAIDSFHELLLSECPNPLIARLAMPVNRRIEHLRAMLFPGIDPAACDLSDFTEIVDAVESRNPEKAEIAVRRRSAIECRAVLAAAHRFGERTVAAPDDR